MTTEHPTTPTLRLLHVEDNQRDAELTKTQISEEWPDCEIVRVDTQADYLSAIRDREFDLILSDFTLPSFSGIDALTIARKECATTPFLFLSGTIGEDNAVAALKNGASDYLMKDRPGRLVSALRNALDLRREQEMWLQAEQRLQEHEELLDKARDAICAADIDGRITYWNRSAASLFGWEGDEGHKANLHTLFGAYNKPATEDAMKELTFRGACNREFRIADDKCGLRYLASRWTLVRRDDGSPKSILVINTDVTQQRHLEAQLHRSQRMEGIGTLAGGIAHDLNNLLTPILLSVQYLRERNTEPDLDRTLELVESGASHGARLVRQVLAFARGEDGEHVEVRPRLVVKDVVMLLMDTLPKSITIWTDLQSDLWSVHANSTQLSQVFMNLAVNARDAMPSGGRLKFKARNVEIDDRFAKNIPGAEAGPHVCITVSDNGAGIAPELIDRIFDPFFTTKSAGKGTGLGLSTVMGIVKGHGGFLTVDSEPDRGTEISIYLPALFSSKTETPPAAPAKPPRGTGETIIIIDDNAPIRELTSKILKNGGYKPVPAEDGLAGLDAFRRHRKEVRAVVVDIMMPGMQGDEVIRRLKLLEPDIRVVAMSGLPLAQTGLVEEPGKLVFLQKPMTANTLISRIQSVAGTEVDAA